MREIDLAIPEADDAGGGVEALKTLDAVVRIVGVAETTALEADEALLDARRLPLLGPRGERPPLAARRRRCRARAAASGARRRRSTAWRRDSRRR